MNRLLKYESLKKTIRALDRVIVAYSGGVDSTLLLKVCLDVLGQSNVVAFIGSSPSFPPEEVEAARNMALSLGADYLIKETPEMTNPDFTQNPLNRCYHCKSGLFDIAWELANNKGFGHVVEGSNYDDLSDFRPGRQACREKNVTSPLLDAGLTKNEIRDLSRELGLSTWDKPAYACLASRIPYGTCINETILNQVGRAEMVLGQLGFRHVRVRYHGDVARIEVPPQMFQKVLEAGEAIVAGLKNLGFLYVSLDLQGYRTGSMNESHL